MPCYMKVENYNFIRHPYFKSITVFDFQMTIPKLLFYINVHYTKNNNSLYFFKQRTLLQNKGNYNSSFRTVTKIVNFMYRVKELLVITTANRSASN